MIFTNIALEIFGIFLTVCILLCSLAEKKDTQNRLFSWMLLCNAFVLLFDMITWVLTGWEEHTVLLYFCNFWVYSLGYIITALFTVYLVNYIAERALISKKIASVIVQLCGVAIVLVLVSLWNGMYFTFEQGVYTRGPLYWLSQAYPVCIILADMFLILWYRKALGWADALSLLSYCFLPVIAMLIQIMVYGITLLYLSTTLSMLIIYLTIQVKKSVTLQKKETELAQAKIAIMLSQIQPHFLYNTLTCISALCDENPKQAKKATVAFSQYLRGNLDSLKKNKLLPFSQELQHIEIYLQLEKMRFEDALNVCYDIQATDFLLPALTIQPIVENAVKHGIGQKEDGGTITIATKETPTHYEIIISDDGVGFVQNQPLHNEKTHIGIENVQARLANMCNGTLLIESERGKGTVATICLPKI